MGCKVAGQEWRRACEGGGRKFSRGRKRVLVKIRRRRRRRVPRVGT